MIPSIDFFDNVNCSTTVEEKIVLCILYIIINFIQIIFGNYKSEFVSNTITIGDDVPCILLKCDLISILYIVYYYTVVL